MRIAYIAGAALAAALIAAAPASAQHDHGAGHGHAAKHGAAHGAEATASASVANITITDAFARAPATPNGAAAAYMTIAIAVGEDRLLSAATDAARRVELHTHLVDDAGVARMREIPAIPVSADAPATLRPGGLHVMLMGVVAPMEPGQTVSLTLTFEKAGAVTLQAPIRAIGAGIGHGGHGHSG